MMIRPIGYVYVLTNPSMPDLVKVGMTDRHNTRARITELSAHTGVPEDFELAYRAQVYGAYEVEQRAHALLSQICPKKKEFFHCDVLAAIDAVLIAAGHDLLDEESYFAQAQNNAEDSNRLKHAKNRLAMLQPRGRSVTGVTRVSFERMHRGDQAKIAWRLHSPTYGYLFYGPAIRDHEKLVKEAARDFPEVEDFSDPVLLETDAGNRVRERQKVQEECDRENDELHRAEILLRLEMKERKAKEVEQREAEREAQAARKEAERKAKQAEREAQAARKEAERQAIEREKAERKALAEVYAAEQKAREDRRNEWLQNEQRLIKLQAERSERRKQLKQLEKYNSQFGERMKTFHNIAPTDICIVGNCERYAAVRFHGNLYCLAHYYTAKSALGD